MENALTPAEIDRFLAQGFVVLHDCFPRDLAKEWTEAAFGRLGYDPARPDTWEKPIVHLPSAQSLPMGDIAPRAWAAACQLLGGEERVAPCWWGDSFIVNFHLGADRAWQPPSPDVGGWHVDGDFFRHFLDSPEQGLLTIVFWSDVESHGGGTFAAPDSISPIARFLAAHPEGVSPGGFDSPARIRECREFAELTGRAGDVVLIHPFMLHASSQNVSGRARFITNPPVNLKEPMQFDRADGKYSPVEQAILNGLGVDKLAFTPTAPRERIVPERVKREQEQKQQEEARTQMPHDVSTK